MAKSNKKMANKSTTAAMAVHPQVWENMPFTLQYPWLETGELFKVAANVPGSFLLVPFYEPDIFGVPTTRLRVTFSGTMRPHWVNSIFDTCGTEPPKLDEDLPEWVDDEPTRRKYHRILRKIIAKLKKDECALQRIEGTYERLVKYDDDVSRRIYVVRGIYLAEAVKTQTSAKTDLVLFVANDPQGGPAPDGGATGPPKPP